MKRYSISISFALIILLSPKQIAYSQPTPSSPADGTEEIVSTVALQWNIDPNADSYILEIANSQVDLSANPINLSTNQYSAGCNFGQTYYWCVASVIGGVPTPFSAISSFWLPPQPVISSISPSQGPSGAPTSTIVGPNQGGLQVSITGTDFGNTTGSVLFFQSASNVNGKTILNYINATSIVQWTDAGYANGSNILCYVPKGASSGNVIVIPAAPNNVQSDVNNNNANFDVLFGYNGWVWTWPQSSNKTIVNFIIDPSGYQYTMSKSSLQTYIDAAANTWSTTSGANIGFVDKTNSGTAVSEINFAAIPTNNGQTVTAQTVANRSNGIISSITTTLNNAIDYDGNGVTLTSTMTHEFGHWLALNDLYGNADNQKVMYGLYNGALKLDPDDALGALSIYGPASSTTPVGPGNNNPGPAGYPNAPINIQAAINGSDVVLTWNDPGYQAVAYEIYKTNNAIIIPTLIATVIYPTCSVTDYGAAGSLPSTYTIYASNSAGTAMSVPITVPPNTVNSNTKWNGFVDINNSVTVNGTLTILPSTTIMFANGASLIVNGRLNTMGESLQPITFTSASGTLPGSWGSIILRRMSQTPLIKDKKGTAMT